MDSSTLSQWRLFYEVVNTLNDLSPWTYAAAEDLFGIDLPGQKEYLFCSVLGNAGDCYGVAIYQGPSGLYDFQRILNQGSSIESQQYVMRDQTGFIVYWGDREEVPPDQKAIIKELGLKTTESNGHEVIIDLCYLDTLVKEKGQAPFYPMVFIIFDKTAD